ncbi:hypothetical protein RRG08_039209 [Elysia crispata]|uniref:SCP domain-containing protein n=1 Tax=Elysia crispata TaxID=231223 RepID=A0AAE1ASY3_9GAST|nr:hypothetical protein RRG08_039209 [Elysia crispata]
MSFFALLDLLQNGPPTPWRAGALPRKEFCERVTKLHNAQRLKHGSYLLRLNDELTNIAQQWAETLIQRKELSHHNNKFRGMRIGQNIAMKWAPNRAIYDPEELCDQWYREWKDFDFGVEPTELKAGHFTQMVWKNSTEIGVGCAQAKDGRSIVVVNYYPPGNVIGEFNANVNRAM